MKVIQCKKCKAVHYVDFKIKRCLSCKAPLEDKKNDKKN